MCSDKDEVAMWANTVDRSRIETLICQNIPMMVLDKSIGVPANVRIDNDGEVTINFTVPRMVVQRLMGQFIDSPQIGFTTFYIPAVEKTS